MLSFIKFLKKKTPPVALGWVVLILCVVGVLITLAGFFFIRREIVDYHLPHRFPVEDPAFFSAAHALANPSSIKGNKITLMHNGDGIFPPMLEAIRNAKVSVNFEMFIFESGEIATQFIDALTERAQAGVQVRLLLDGVGAGAMLDSADVDRLVNAGCKFSYFHPVRSWRLERLNIRNHRRIMVVDGRVAFTGGVGIGDVWLGNADSPEHWREVHAKLEGPIVTRLQAAFQHHWFSSTGETLAGAGDFPELEPAGDLEAQVVDTAAFIPGAFSLVQAVAFSSATKSIYITNAYSAPGKGQIQSLIEAAERGVDVRLLIPGSHLDQPATKIAGRSAYGELLEAGVKIYEYQPTMIHTKTAVVDGLFSVFGSSNFDNRSSRINEELDITVLNAGFGKQMQEVFFADLKNSKPYTLKEFKSRPWTERISEILVWPFHPQL